MDNDVPPGAYCYWHDGQEKILCKYWEKTALGAKCHFLGEEHIEEDPFHLAWDQVKCCGLPKLSG